MFAHRRNERAHVRSSQEMLRRAALTLTKAGDEFLPAVVQEIAMVLDAQLALVGELTGDGRVQTIAAWEGGQLVENFDYPLAGTPCEQLLEQKELCVPDGVRHSFPADEQLTALGAEGYIGVLLTDTKGAPLGVIAAVTTRPLGGEAHAASLFPLFAGRVAAEMQRQRTERELRRSEEHLRQVQRGEAIGRLAGGIAHDFNNLLMIVIGYGEILRERQGSSKEITELLAAANRATTLTRQLLAYGRRQVLQVQRINMNRVVADVQAMLAGVIGGDIRLLTALDPQLPTVAVDRGQMEQVLVNLAINARDAMPDGGTLRIETSVARVATPHLQMPAGDYVRIAVSDTGVGMSAEVQAHIFEPFYTTKGNHGSGLGLSSVYGIVKQSGGFIWCHSELGRGTTFEVFLRPVAAAPDAPPAPDLHADTTPVGAERVLVVDDDPGVRQLLARILSTRGYMVLEAQDGAAALALLDALPEPVDLLITDVVMPVMNGVKLVEEAHARWPRMRLLFVSGYPQGTRPAAGVLASRVPVLAKPFTPARIASAVRDILDAPPTSSPRPVRMDV
jgi:signal transduction histidine kinase/ActR/RegA family two-component response regulator